MYDMAKAGIVTQLYRLEKYKEKLKTAGFDNYATKLFPGGVVSITVEASEEKLKEIGRICTEVDLHFKRSN